LTLLSIGQLSTEVMSGPYSHPVGGWLAPLGITLWADGLAVWMLLLNAVVGLGVSLFAGSYFKAQAARQFWPLWLLLWGGLNGLYLSADLFNLFVTLEVVSLAAVALVTLSGERIALIAAMRYLLAAIFGSLAYLLGVALIYAEHSALSLLLLADFTSTPGTLLALSLMTLGLLLKTAIFPFHFWLPLAHASAPAPVSALLSALVVKASYYLLLRLWLFVYGDGLMAAAQVLALLGAVALLYGSLQAFRQRRFKLLVAYSTVAQLGYLCLAIPLIVSGMVSAYHGALYHALAHALAKAALFLAAGLVLQAYGHDRITGLRGMATRLPVTTFAVTLAAVSLAGLPPSGGFVAKWWLVTAAIDSGQWVWVLIMLLGGLLSALYLFRVLAIALLQPHPGLELRPVPRGLELIALALALLAILIGLRTPELLALLAPGLPLGGSP
jgi:formate hydrogenlyase subunit 3/multisubunit Na+/H+ antiporter MnhD subunit